MTARTNLSIVGPSPESELRSLFDAEDALMEQLAQVRERQRPARKRYAEAHGLLILPSMSKLREVLG